MYAKFIRKKLVLKDRYYLPNITTKRELFAIFTAIAHVKKLLDICIIFSPNEGSLITYKSKFLESLTLFSTFFCEIQYINSYSFTR